ncbi:MAG: rRNA methyltransferase [Bacteroidetes bacterium HGW-Bacteroidetes-6]|jgi:tRNA (guanosine-2'-O-)-methyltransferase|nr:MAG: rRNA methyltransferase [Bacteroidetes bacterium HGW-Bacteroidetes-6]
MIDLNLHRNRIDELIAFLQPFITEKRFDRISEIAAQRTEYITVVLENLYQGHNASAVLRTCDCFGVLNIHAIESVNRFSPNEEIALGAEKWLNINHYTSSNGIADAYSLLRNKGYAIAATTPHGNPISIEDIPVNKPLALVFGTEKDGLSAEALKQADFTVALPMYGFTESFNISVSAALFLQKVTDKMIQSKINRSLPIEEQKFLIANWILKTVRDPEGLMRNFLIDRT